MINIPEINTSSLEKMERSFDEIADRLFNDFQLEVNKEYYRLVDIEFYYYSEKRYEDIYTHKHEAQLQNGKWYFHSSGIDITFGDWKSYGGILIRGIVKLFGETSPEKYFIQKEIHGPLKVKTELCSNFHDVFNYKPNVFQFHNISADRMMAGMKVQKFIKTKRIGLNSAKDTSSNKQFYNSNLRYVIFPHLKLKNKTQIALDMQLQFPKLTNEEINKQFGSIFLK